MIQALISIITGICDAFERYNDFISIYENVLKAKNYAKNQNLPDLNHFILELKIADKLKEKFDKNIIEESNKISTIYVNSLNSILDEFKEIIVLLNNEVNLFYIGNKIIQ